MRYMEVEAGGAQTRVTEQQLDAAQVDPGFEQMGGECVTKEMGINSLRQLGGMPRFFAHEGDPVAGDGLGDAMARKEPGLELIELPVAAEEWQQVGRQHDHTIAFALALADVDHHPSGVDVGALEVTEFGDPYTGGIQGREDRAMLEVTWGEEQRLHFVATQDDREGLRLLGVRDRVDHPRAMQGGLVQKTEGTHGLDEDAFGDLPLEEMELIGADVFRTEAIGCGAKVLGELGHIAQIPIDGAGGIVADRPVFEHTST